MFNTLSSTPLERLQNILEYASYPTRLQPLQPGSDTACLQIGPGFYLRAPGQYDPERQLLIELAFLNDLLRLQDQPTLPHSDFLHFRTVLPFAVPAAARTDLLVLINRFNLLLPLGSFGLDPAGQVFFSYPCLVPDQAVETLVLIDTLDMIVFFVESLGHVLEALATGRQTLDQALKTEIAFNPAGLSGFKGGPRA